MSNPHAALVLTLPSGSQNSIGLWRDSHQTAPVRYQLPISNAHSKIFKTASCDSSQRLIVGRTPPTAARIKPTGSLPDRRSNMAFPVYQHGEEKPFGSSFDHLSSGLERDFRWTEQLRSHRHRAVLPWHDGIPHWCIDAASSWSPSLQCRHTQSIRCIKGEIFQWIQNRVLRIRLNGSGWRISTLFCVPTQSVPFHSSFEPGAPRAGCKESSAILSAYVPAAFTSESPPNAENPGGG
jgi:hypothetical protein